jgi:hypothetical protein
MVKISAIKGAVIFAMSFTVMFSMSKIIMSRYMQSFISLTSAMLLTTTASFRKDNILGRLALYKNTL